MEFILRLVLEISAKNKDAKTVNLIVRAVPLLGRKSLRRDPWYKGLIMKPFVEITIEQNVATCWFINGRLHREDGPALDAFGNKAWYKHGKRHREDGPAIETALGIKLWYINGKEVGLLK